MTSEDILQAERLKLQDYDSAICTSDLKTELEMKQER